MITILKVIDGTHLTELVDFFKLTAFFGKKFYRKNFVTDENNCFWIQFYAVATSRDLTLKANVKIKALYAYNTSLFKGKSVPLPKWLKDEVVAFDALNKSGAMIQKKGGERLQDVDLSVTDWPECGGVPVNHDDALIVFPALQIGNFLDCFAYEGFMRVDEITES